MAGSAWQVLEINLPAAMQQQQQQQQVHGNDTFSNTAPHGSNLCLLADLTFAFCLMLLSCTCTRSVHTFFDLSLTSRILQSEQYD